MTTASEASVTKSHKSIKKRPVVSGIVLLGIGVLWLLAMQDVVGIEQGWPLIIIIVGLAIVAAAMTRDKKPPRSTSDHPHHP
jgi:hypothetical protein